MYSLWSILKDFDKSGKRKNRLADVAEQLLERGTLDLHLLSKGYGVQLDAKVQADRSQSLCIKMRQPVNLLAIYTSPLI